MAFIYDLSDIWNNAGTSFNGIKLNATDTASAAGSKLLDLQINGASKLAVGKTGALTATGLIESTVGGFRFPDGTTQTTKATVNSVSGTGTVNGLTLTGTVTNSGSLTLGGTLVLTSGQVTTALGYSPVQTIGSTDGSVTVTGTTAINLSVATAGSTSNVLLPVRNTTGATLTKGTAVYISGATGQISTVSKAIANSDATSAQTIGLITADLANNTNGNVTLIGTITNINTSAYTDGQQLYLSPTTAGTLTATKPYAPQHLVYIAVVEHAHPSQGKLFVKVQNGYEMDELHDVSAQSPLNNDGLFYNTTTGLWENKSIVTALGYTPYNATNPSGYLTSSTASTTYQPLDGDLTAIAALAGTTGIVRKTAANTYTLDTAAYLTGITSGQVTTALGYTPANRAGDTFTGSIIVNGNTTLGDAVGDLATVPDQLALEYTTDSLPTTRPALSLDFVDVGALDPRVTFTRSTTATFVGSNGLIQTAAINAPRFDYNPTTLAPRGLLIEEQRVNLLTYSEQFDNAAWQKFGGGTGLTPTVTPNFATAPDGTMTADRVQMSLNGGTTLSDSVNVSQSATFAAGAYVLTVWLRSNTGSNQTILGVIANSQSVDSPITVTPTWQRFTVTQTTAAVTSNSGLRLRGTFTGDTADILVWGAQLEAGAFATSYIPTVASQVTRSADNASMTGTNFSSWFNASEGTFVADSVVAPNVDGVVGNYYYSASDGTISNMILSAEVNGTVSQVIAGGVTQFNETVGGEPTGALKVALAYQANNTVSSANGAIGTTDTSVTLPTVNRLSIGVRGDLSASTFLNGHIRSITYFNTRLSNAVLQGVTR